MTPSETFATPLEDRLLPWRLVKELTGLSRTTAWRLQKSGDFPAPLVISPGRVGWRASDLEAWKATRVVRRGAAPPQRSRSEETAASRQTPTPPAAKTPESAGTPPRAARAAVRRRPGRRTSRSPGPAQLALDL